MTTTDAELQAAADYFGLASSWADTAPGETTHYHDLGEGVPMLFVHGSGAGVSAAANWWLNLPSIAEHHRTIAVDLIGFGRTVDAPDTEYGIKAWVAHLCRLLDTLGLERTWLVGNSLGGWIALQMAIDHPERVLGVISMGTGGAKRKTGALASHGAPQVTPEGIRKVLEDFVVDTSLVADELVDARYALARSDGAEERFRRVVAGRERDREQLPLDDDALAALQCPVLLTHGREDSVIPVERSWRLANLIPRAELHVYSACGHWSQVEKASAFNDLLVDFVTRHLDVADRADA